LLEDARAVREFYARAEFLGDDSDIVRLIEEAGLGRLLESDHLIEQRFIDELAWGNASFFRRSEVRSLGRDAERIDDITAIATPKNEIIYYRLARRSPNTGFELAGLYPHTGPGSKTTRMAQFIPVGSEGAHSLLDIANAHRWVLINEQGFPAIYEHHFLEDLAHALIVGMERNPQLRRQATRIIGNNLDTRNIVRYLRSTGRPTMETFSPQNWPRYKEIEMPTIL